MSLAGKSALVTGGGSGIGASAAMRLAEEGCRVAIVDVRQGDAGRVAALITARGGTAVTIVGPVTGLDTVKVPRAARTRSARPRRPVESSSVSMCAPPRPSSNTETCRVFAASSVRTVTTAWVASACLATFVSASATTK